jgi:hypothetical protein
MKRNATYYKRGDWNAICDRCGAKFKASQLRKTWEGFMVCQKDWEPRHPQDYVRAPREEAVPEWTRSNEELPTNLLVADDEDS